MVILVDQDGVLAYFELGFLRNWRMQFPNEPFIPLEQRRTFYPRDQYPKELKEKVESIYFASGFFLNLPPVPGAIEAMKTMVAVGHDVRICTSPLGKFENCVLEKYLWIEKYLGKDFTKGIILSKDKTLIKGRFLIDDKPVIENAENAEWEHVVFEAPYNREVEKKRINWSNYREILGV